MSELFRERNDLDAAIEHLQASRELGEHAGLPQNAYRWRVAMARVREAEGDLVGAVELLDEAERLYVGDFFPERAAGRRGQGTGAGGAGGRGRGAGLGTGTRALRR